MNLDNTDPSVRHVYCCQIYNNKLSFGESKCESNIHGIESSQCHKCVFLRMRSQLYVGDVIFLSRHQLVVLLMWTQLMTHQNKLGYIIMIKQLFLGAPSLCGADMSCIYM